MKFQVDNTLTSVLITYLMNGFTFVIGGAIAYGVYRAVSPQVEEFIQHALSNFPPLR